MKKFMVLMAMLMMVLPVASPAFARSEAAVKVTGRLAEIADQPYATHGIRDEASGDEYLLRSDTVDLDAYNGKRATVYGAYAFADASPVSGDVSASSKTVDEPRLVDVIRVEAARYMDGPTPCDEYLPSGEPNPDYDPGCPVIESPNEEVTVTFDLAIDGEVPEGRILSVDTGIQDVAHPVFCSTTTYSSSLPRCEDGGTYSDTFEVPAGSLSYEYTVFDQNYGGIVEAFAADTRTCTEDETVSATYRIGDPGNKVTVIQATGKLEKPEVTTYQYGSHAITDEASGEDYALKSSIVDLEPYVGQRVTLYGALVPGYEDGQIEGGPPLIDVYQVEPVIDPDKETVTATFELTVEGEPPAGTEFIGNMGQGQMLEASATLLDQDGDGVYTSSLPVERGTEHEVWIAQATPLNNDDPYAPLVSSTIKDFGMVQFDEDETFSATVSFKDGNGGSGNGGGKFLSNIAGGAKGLLPSTGGGEALTLLGGGALLIVGGLILRKLVWR